MWRSFKCPILKDKRCQTGLIKHVQERNGKITGLNLFAHDVTSLQCGQYSPVVQRARSMQSIAVCVSQIKTDQGGCRKKLRLCQTKYKRKSCHNYFFFKTNYLKYSNFLLTKKNNNTGQESCRQGNCEGNCTQNVAYNLLWHNSVGQS